MYKCTYSQQLHADILPGIPHRLIAKHLDETLQFILSLCCQNTSFLFSTSEKLSLAHKREEVWQYIVVHHHIHLLIKFFLPQTVMHTCIIHKLTFSQANLARWLSLNSSSSRVYSFLCGSVHPLRLLKNTKFIFKKHIRPYIHSWSRLTHEILMLKMFKNAK